MVEASPGHRPRREAPSDENSYPLSLAAAISCAGLLAAVGIGRGDDDGPPSSVFPPPKGPYVACCGARSGS
ncbi:hypothetical protein GCM10010307_24800 [Streptomyces vastus]|uniref:Uncharacterized protein n=1 Tax=Streptomyces vastus TaxID=285451 RepID=A0ABP6D6R7_9ACTN